MTDEMLRIANCSGFYGDRLSAAREMVDGGPIDVLTGDWLAELTMLILAKGRMKDPAAGYARTFPAQMEQVLGTCLDREIRVVANAGGLHPAACAAAVRELADRLGLSVTVAHVEGDDLMPRLGELAADGIDLVNLDTGEKLADLGVEPLTANAYLGGWGIAEALRRGADVVVTGRVTDAAVVMGPAAWRFGWDRTDWDPLAGALVAGHVIECGTQTCGGNYSFFEEVPGLEYPGFPIAEMLPDGSSVITKHPGTGGLVSVGTVTAQLLYEIGSVEYANPDVVARFDTIRLDQDGPDRVRISGVRGEPAPDQVKVAVNYLGGHRNTMTFVLTGLDVEAKADLAERTLWSLVPGGRAAFDETDVQLVRSDREDPATNEDAMAHLRITVKDRDEQKVGRAFSNKVIEMVLANYPGFFATSPPTAASSYGVYWPALIPAGFPLHEVVLDDERISIPPTAVAAGDRPTLDPPPAPTSTEAQGPTEPAPLGRVVGARSGDKGGNANVGVWTRTDEAYAWLSETLTTDRLRQLLPEARDLEVERHDLPNLRAVNFVLRGWLGRGVAACTRLDPQAKGLGEYLRARWVDVPRALLDPSTAEAMDWVRVLSEPCPFCGYDTSLPTVTELGPTLVAEADRWERWLTDHADDAALPVRPDPGTWSALDYACHVRDVLSVMAARVERALVEDRPELGWWDHEAAADEEAYRSQDPRTVARAIRQNADHFSGLLALVSGTEWDREGTRRRGETFTVGGLARFSLHEVHHHRGDAQRSRQRASTSSREQG